MTKREENIIEMVQQHRYVETSMISKRLFRFKTGQYKAWQVLARMASRGLVHRFRTGPRSEYVYHLDAKRSAKWRHWLELNRFHFALLAGLKSWQRLLYWDFEVRYPFGQADGFYQVQTTIQGDGVMFFVEVDDGGNKFDKIAKYLAYWRSKTWRGEWWSQGAFPLVVIVTPRAREIEGLIRRCCKAEEQEIFVVVEKENISDSLINQITGRMKP